MPEHEDHLPGQPGRLAPYEYFPTPEPSEIRLPPMRQSMPLDDRSWRYEVYPRTKEPLGGEEIVFLIEIVAIVAMIIGHILGAW